MTTIYPDGTFKALDPFFNVIQQGRTGFVDGERFFDNIPDDAIFEFLFSGYGNMIALRDADELVVHKSQDPRVVIRQFQVTKVAGYAFG
jgi:hypothetical protein